MWCKAPSHPPLSSTNVCGAVPRLSRGRGRQIIMRLERENRVQKIVISPERAMLREENIAKGTTDPGVDCFDQ